MGFEDTYGIKLQLSVDDGADAAIKKIRSFARACEKLKVPADEAKVYIKESLKPLEQFNNKATDQLTELGKKMVACFDEFKASNKLAADEKKAKEEAANLNKEISELEKKLRGLGKIANPFEFLSAKKGFNLGGFLGKLAETNVRYAPLANMFRNVSAVWNFVDGIAALNKQFMQLAQTSGMSAGELKNLSNAAEVFGGSAKSIAASNQRFIKTIEDMKRGKGMGFIGDVAYKYGFMADINADWQTNTQAAIQAARGMDKNTRMAFLMDFDRANYRQNIAYANMDEGRYEAYMSRMNTPEKAAAAEGATAATEDFLMSTSLLSSAWQEICDKIAESLLPVMTTIVNIVTSVVEVLASIPTGVYKVIAAIGVVLGIIKSVSLISNGINTARALSAKLLQKEGEQIVKNTALSKAQLAVEKQKLMFANPLLWAALVGGGALLGWSMWKDKKDASAKQEQERKAREQYEHENVSLSDVMSGKKELTPLEKWVFGINDDRLMHDAVKTVTHEEMERDKSITSLAEAATGATEALAKMANAAEDAAEDVSLNTLASEANQIFSRSSSNANIQTNVEINNAFEEATKDAVRVVGDQMGEELQRIFHQAARSGVAI